MLLQNTKETFKIVISAIFLTITVFISLLRFPLPSLFNSVLLFDFSEFMIAILILFVGVVYGLIVGIAKLWIVFFLFNFGNTSEPGVIMDTILMVIFILFWGLYLFFIKKLSIATNSKSILAAFTLFFFLTIAATLGWVAIICNKLFILKWYGFNMSDWGWKEIIATFGTFTFIKYFINCLLAGIFIAIAWKRLIAICQRYTTENVSKADSINPELSLDENTNNNINPEPQPNSAQMNQQPDPLANQPNFQDPNFNSGMYNNQFNPNWNNQMNQQPDPFANQPNFNQTTNLVDPLDPININNTFTVDPFAPSFEQQNFNNPNNTQNFNPNGQRFNNPQPQVNKNTRSKGRFSLFKKKR